MSLKPIATHWKFEDTNGRTLLEAELVDIPGKIELVGEKSGREVVLEVDKQLSKVQDRVNNKIAISIPSDVFDELVCAYFVGRDPIMAVQQMLKARF